jgi:2-dehydro-3-deoxygluconokinase
VIISEKKETYLKQSARSSEEIMNRFSSCRSVANTFRFDRGGGIQYYTTLYTGNDFYVSKEYRAERILDKVGSGDCFMAGLIYGFTRGDGPQQTLEFATAAAFDKLFIASDATTSTAAQINQRIAHAE